MSLLDRFLKPGGTSLKIPDNVTKYMSTVFKSSVKNQTSPIQGKSTKLSIPPNKLK